MGEFYQQITKGLIEGVYTKQVLSVLAGRLINLADHAYQLRQMDSVGEISRLLMGLPLPRQYESISNYYRAIHIKKNGKLDEARTLLSLVADEAPLRFRARAIMSLGVTLFESGDFQSALSLYSEAGHTANHLKRLDPITTVGLQAAYSVLNSLESNHRGALSRLESMLPLVRMIASEYPFLWYQHLNSLAIELSEVRRIEEAQNICRIVVASPYASAYPEWRETCDDIQMKSYRTSRSTLSLNHRALNIGNVVRLPLAERDEDASPEKSYRSPFHQHGSVTVLKAWKEGKMVKQPNGDEKKDEEMDDRDVFMEIMRLSSQEGMSSKRLWEILEAVRKVTSKPDEG